MSPKWNKRSNSMSKLQHNMANISHQVLSHKKIFKQHKIEGLTVEFLHRGNAMDKTKLKSHAYFERLV